MCFTFIDPPIQAHEVRAFDCHEKIILRGMLDHPEYREHIDKFIGPDLFATVPTKMLAKLIIDDDDQLDCTQMERAALVRVMREVLSMPATSRADADAALRLMLDRRYRAVLVGTVAWALEQFRLHGYLRFIAQRLRHALDIAEGLRPFGDGFTPGGGV